jgi:hypothetical protein
VRREVGTLENFGVARVQRQLAGNDARMSFQSPQGLQVSISSAAGDGATGHLTIGFSNKLRNVAQRQRRPVSSAASLPDAQRCGASPPSRSGAHHAQCSLKCGRGNFRRGSPPTAGDSKML